MRDEQTAALFVNGGNQAVRLPKAFRFEGTAVRIRREGHAVILEPLGKAAWPAGFWERLQALGPPSADLERPEPLPSSLHRGEVLGSLDG